MTQRKMPQIARQLTGATRYISEGILAMKTFDDLAIKCWNSAYLIKYKLPNGEQVFMDFVTASTREEAVEKVQKYRPGLIVWCDSQLD